jgi:Holliday junction resolvasome RuvABC endonuclease subunit
MGLGRSNLNLEGSMSIKKIVSRKRVQGRVVGRAKKGSIEKRGDTGLSRRLQDLREQVDIVLPEMTARIAALEHLLREKQLCTRQDLISARQFVRMQEA